MRFIHTADWHLGRIFHGVHMTGDQAYVLDQFIGIVADARPDAVLIAGDVYDRAVPPPEAVALLDDVLFRLRVECNVPVVAIAGNHDSPDRFGFAARILSGGGLHLTGNLDPEPAPIRFGDAHGPVHVVPVPFAEPVRARQFLADETLRDHDAVTAAVVARVAPHIPNRERTILVGHAFVFGGVAGDTERPLSVGGAETVPAERFAGFHYTALGHLHRAQSITETVRYSGSLMKYGFDEPDRDKTVDLVEMDGEGRCSRESIPLSPLRDVRTVTGRFDDLMHEPASDDYIRAVLTDTGPILDAFGRLRENWPNLLAVNRPGLMADTGQGNGTADLRKHDTVDLFGAFFRQVTGAEMTPEQETALREVVDRVEADRREAL